MLARARHSCPLKLKIIDSLEARLWWSHIFDICYLRHTQITWPQLYGWNSAVKPYTINQSINQSITSLDIKTCHTTSGIWRVVRKWYFVLSSLIPPVLSTSRDFVWDVQISGIVNTIKLLGLLLTVANHIPFRRVSDFRKSFSPYKPRVKTL